MLADYREFNFPVDLPFEARTVLTNLLEVCRSLPVPVYRDKSSKQQRLDLAHPILNAVIEYWLHHTLGWKRQCTIASMTSGLSTERKTIDFVFELIDGRVVAIEIQFGNGGRIQADFAKFRTIHEQGKLAMGIAVYLVRATAETADSGLATYEAAERDAHKFGDMPVAIVGLTREGMPEVDLQQIPGLVFPAVLGGSGTGRFVLHHFIAEAIVEAKVPLAELRLNEDCQQIIQDQALAYIDKLNNEVADAVARIAACRDHQLQTLMLARMADASRSSYIPAAEQHKVAREAGHISWVQEKAKAKAKEEARKARAEQKKAEKQAARQARAAKGSSQRAVKTPSAKDSAESSAASLSPAPVPSVPTTQAALALAPKRLFRVTKAQELARTQQPAAGTKRPDLELAAQRTPTWNAMGNAFAQAFGRAKAA